MEFSHLVFNNNLRNNSFFFSLIFIKMFPNIFINILINNGDLFLNLKREYLKFFLLVIKKHTNFQFKKLVDIWGIDFFELKKRFQVNYCLISIPFNKRIFIKVSLKINQTLNSAINIFNSANWLEREVWDMFGIFFFNHSDLRRILTDYGFEGFPLRKDFPLSGFTEVYFDLEQKRLIYTLTELTQEFRMFKFDNPWNFKIV